MRLPASSRRLDSDNTLTFFNRQIAHQRKGIGLRVWKKNLHGSTQVVRSAAFQEWSGAMALFPVIGNSNLVTL